MKNLKRYRIVKDTLLFLATVGLGVLLFWYAMQFPRFTPPSAQADPTPTCTPAITPSCSPTITVGPSCPPALNCSPCASDPDCTPIPWPTVSVSPTITPIPSTFWPEDGTILEWRRYYPGPVRLQEPTPYPAPIVIVLHGGNWNSGTPFHTSVDAVARQIALSGFWVFAADYRLAPCARITGQPEHATPTATPTPGNTPPPDPSGRPPEQTDDVMSLLLAAEADTSRFNDKIAIVATSSGGNIGAYVTQDRETITDPNRPHWTAAARPDCIVTFSSPFDLADQTPDDLTQYYPQYIKAVHNYIGTCNRDVARAASPISLIVPDIASDFKPMFMVQTEGDPTCPYRQIFDMACALQTAGVDPCDYQMVYVTEGNHNSDHGFELWFAPNPTNPNQTIGAAALAFLHKYLD